MLNRTLWKYVYTALGWVLNRRMDDNRVAKEYLLFSLRYKSSQQILVSLWGGGAYLRYPDKRKTSTYRGNPLCCLSLKCQDWCFKCDYSRFIHSPQYKRNTTQPRNIRVIFITETMWSTNLRYVESLIIPIYGLPVIILDLFWTWSLYRKLMVSML